MKYTLCYGRETLTLDLPDDLCRRVIQPSFPPAIPDPDAAITRCLDDPVGTPPLSKILEGRRRIVVVIPDATRAGAIPLYVGPLLRYLRAHGVSRERATLLSATGAHGLHSEAQRAALVGPEIAAQWTVEDHDCDRGNVEIEPLDAETPVAVDRHALEADCLILAGQISFHYCAGFGGGRKLIAPGLCGRATVHALHRRTLANIDADGNWHSRTGVLHHNPFHEAMLAVARRVGPRFTLHATFGLGNQLLGVAAGDLVKAHVAACLQYAQIFTCPVPERLPLVVASCGGWPLDGNLYQAHKAFDNAFRAVQRGGTILLLAECSGGWGPEAFVRWLAIPTLAEHRQRLRAEFQVEGHTTYAFKWKATQCRVIIVSHVLDERITAGDAPAWLRGGPSPFQIEIVGTIGEALERLGAGGRRLPYYLMPNGAACLPEVTG